MQGLTILQGSVLAQRFGPFIFDPHIRLPRPSRPFTEVDRMGVKVVVICIHPVKLPQAPFHWGKFVDSRYALYLFINSALPTTLTEEKAIAAAAIIGFNKKPKNGYKTPAAIGMPTAL